MEGLEPDLWGLVQGPAGAGVGGTSPRSGRGSSPLPHAKTKKNIASVNQIPTRPGADPSACFHAVNLEQRDLKRSEKK